MANNTITVAGEKIPDVLIKDRSFKAFRRLCTPLRGEDVVIAGIAGKYPNSDNINQFRDNLYSKADMLSDDNRRWRPYPGVPQRTGKLNDISSFDAGFFGLDRHNANFMDPIIRLLLERSFEAILDAGYNPTELQSRKVGVFIGTSFSETEKVIMYDKPMQKDQVPIGTTFSMIPQFISYCFGLQGPSCILDSGCSSSLYALAHAFKNLRDGVCDMALVGGANLCLHAVISLQFTKLGVLSADGNCKTFDNRANGFVRSESASVILLQRSKDARRVYARVIHSKPNCDGFKEEGFAFPSTEMQTTLLKETYQECNVDVSDVTYIEAHGTGTYVGDIQELTTLTEVFCQREREKPLYIGSVKSNAGHTECTAGLTSIAKIIISMENECIPGNRNYVSPRNGVGALQTGQLKVVSEKTLWPDHNGLAGINSFGIGGANAHTVLQWNTKLKANSGLPKDDLPCLVCISGRCKDAVEIILDNLSGKQMDAEVVQLLHSIFGKNVMNHPYRGYSILNRTGEVKRSVTNSVTHKSEFVWVFNSYGSNWYTIGRHLNSISIFAEHLERIQKRIQKKVAFNIAEIMKNSKAENMMNQILATVTIQISLGETLRSLGLRPSSAIGLGTGEIIAAYFKGFLTLDEVIFICTSIGSTNTINGTPFIYKLFNNFKWLLFKKDAEELKKLPLCLNHNNQTQAASFFKKDLTEYLSQNSRVAFEMRKEFLSNNPTTLVIGSAIEGLERFSLIPEHSTDHIFDFLSVLGNVYENGHSMELDKLYPKMPWPVGRGTPMISPLIKWETGQDWFVALKKDESEVRSGQRLVHVVTKEPEWKYVTGHVVDGSNLFPASGFITIVWETFAKRVGKFTSDMRVVFENIKFLRTVNLTGQDDVEMIVSIQEGDNNFEVCEGGFTVVTGQIYEMQDDHELTNLHVPAEEYVGGISTMTHDDVYKELGIRGYKFTGQFKGIKECDIGINKGLVTWMGNWALFIDSMFQMKVLRIDTRNLRVPIYIKQLIIDGPKQTHLLGGDFDKEITLPVYVHNELDLTRSGAVEIRQAISQEVQKRRTGVQVLETYKFIPNITALNLAESMRVMVQMILENHSTGKFKSVELDVENLELLSPYIKKCIDSLPSVQAELAVLSRAPLNITGVKVGNNKLGMETEALIVIVPDLFDNEELLTEALGAIKDMNGYIITRESGFFDASMMTYHGLNILSVHINKLETFVLLQKQAEDEESIVIDISNHLDDMSWLSKAQKAVRRGRHLIIYSQNKFVNGILGFVNCLLKEPYNSKISCFFIIDNAPKFDLNLAFYKNQAEKNLSINVWKDGVWGTYRHLRIDENVSVQCEHCYANVTVRGDPSSVKFLEGPLQENTAMPYGKELIYVYCSGLNFRDVMLATGKIAADVVTKNRAEQECVQGLEFVGRDKFGKRVMGMVQGRAISNCVTADSKLLWPVPDEWTFEDAATIPIAYSMVIYGLIMRANIQRGQSILIHSCTQALGLAAINIALYYDCNIFVTTEHARHKNYLRKHYPQIPESHIGNTTVISFEHMIRTETKGHGVDVILNVLSEEKLSASLRCLGQNGHFVEFGRFDADRDNNLQMEEGTNGITFHGVVLDAIFKNKSVVKAKLFCHMEELIGNGAIKPLPRTVFEKDDVTDAYKFLMNQKHLGKVLVKIRKEEKEKLCRVAAQMFQGKPRYFCHPNCTFVIVGGLGGFGLELADWLIIRGARNLVLTSRTGLKNGYTASRLRLWQMYGINVEIRTDHIITEEGCAELLNYANSLGPVKAIFNLAVVLKDGLFENQTRENYTTVLNPKATATQHLDVLTRKMCPDLSDFVVFSSLACGRGNAGQTNYGMANSVMERICEQRKLDGYPALAIQWGAIGDVGIVADIQKKNEAEITVAGTLQQRIASCLQVMDVFLRQNEPVVASMIVAEKRSFNSASDIIDVVSNMLGVIDLNKISMHTTFPELGMDSITSLEIKQVLKNDYDIFLQEQDMKTMTFAKFKELAAAKMADKEESQKSQ